MEKVKLYNKDTSHVHRCVVCEVQIPCKGPGP